MRHLVVIEDGVNELRPDHPYVTHIVVPPASEAEGGRTAGDMAEAAKSALRKNTDQVVYGEILDGNAGHVIANASSFRFSATTLHGHTIEAGLSRFCILAQLDNTLPRSPYVGLDNLLVRRDLALCFKVVVLCGRLADDRQVVREITWLDGIDDSGAFKLTRLVTLVEENAPACPPATWCLNQDFALPADYRVNLHAQDLAAAHRLAVGVTPAAAYQQALTAVHSSNWEAAAAGYLLRAVEAAATSATRHVPGEVVGLLSRVIEQGGAWEPLQAQGKRAAQALDRLRSEQRWEALEQALAALSADLPLALAVGEALDLMDLRQAAQCGRERNAEVQSRLEMAARLAGSQRQAEALELLLGGGDGLDVEHYAALAGTARPLFEALAPKMSPLQRAAFSARLDALDCLAGVPSLDGEEGAAGASEPVSALHSIEDRAQQTTERIVHIAEDAWV